MNSLSTQDKERIEREAKEVWPNDKDWPLRVSRVNGAESERLKVLEELSALQEDREKRIARELNLQEEVERRKDEYRTLQTERNEWYDKFIKVEQQNRELREALKQFYLKCDLTRLQQSTIESVENLLKG